MEVRMSIRRLSLFLVLFAAAIAYADAPGVYAITGGTVHPVSGADIPNGTVIIRGGLVEAVGANVAVPADATLIDVKGGHIYPGLIDAHTSLGFPSASARPRGFGGGGGGAAARPAAAPLPETGPAFMALREAKLSDDDVDAKRATGVTTIVTAPSFGIFNGQSAIINLGEGNIDTRVIRAPASQQISFNPRPAWTYPDSLMGVIAYIRQTFMDTQHYTAAHAVYDKSPAGLKRPDDSVSAQALEAVMRRDVPIVFVADSDAMIRRAQTIAKEFNLRYIISGARQGYRIADELKTIPVLVSVKWPVAPANRDDREEQPLRVIRDRQLAPTTPATLQKSGVTYALVSGAGGKTSDLLPGIRKAIDNGLGADDALRAVTLTPAKIFGIDKQLGSLDRGKIANVVVTDKPIFTKDAKVKREFIDGREIRLPAEETTARRGAAGEASSPVEGTWHLTVKSSQGDVSISVTLHVESGGLTGTFSGDRGSGDIRGGSVDGSTVEFTIAAQAQSTETSDWVFHGTLREGTMEGTVSTTQGTFPFSGSKSR
jgi:imidazolonepropionase-like amidohydrolase